MELSEECEACNCPNHCLFAHTAIKPTSSKEQITSEGNHVGLRVVALCMKVARPSHTAKFTYTHVCLFVYPLELQLCFYPKANINTVELLFSLDPRIHIMT